MDVFDDDGIVAVIFPRVGGTSERLLALAVAVTSSRVSVHCSSFCFLPFVTMGSPFGGRGGVPDLVSWVRCSDGELSPGFSAAFRFPNDEPMAAGQIHVDGPLPRGGGEPLSRRGRHVAAYRAGVSGLQPGKPYPCVQAQSPRLLFSSSAAGTTMRSLLPGSSSVIFGRGPLFRRVRPVLFSASVDEYVPSFVVLALPSHWPGDYVST